MGEKEGRKLNDVFFRYKDFTVIAREAVYEGKGRFRFKGGSLIVKMEGKYFITFFDNYTLDTIKIVSPKKRELRISQERVYNLVNIFTSLPLTLLGFFIALRILRYHTHIYYASALIIIFKEIFMFVDDSFAVLNSSVRKTASSKCPDPVERCPPMPEYVKE